MNRAGRLAPLAALACALLARPGQAAPPPMTRDDIICRANSAVGYSYWWGGACWCASGCSHGSCPNGGCTGNCPNCVHSGSYGADCSGLVTKVWQVPNPINTTTCGHGPYVAATYTGSTSYWHTKSRSSVEQGDSFASKTHVLIYHYGDPWGQMRTYEARGCAYGIQHSLRSCSSDYVAAQRINIGPVCECSPGEKQSGACGNCGTRHRTCGSDCKWNAWSGCEGQGPCSPGHVQERDCCDCGTQSRSCNNSCEWRDWSACAGADPNGGQTSCDTGEPGPCASGKVRCLKGCRTCVRDYEPTPETCDDIDNDCSGEVDDGHPTEMSTPPPAHAARLEDFSHPMALAPGESGTAWASFTNLGTATWTRGQLWLSSSSAAHGQPSPLYDQEHWPSWDVAAVLDEEVAPGQTAWLQWQVRTPLDAEATTTDTFVLVRPPDAPIRCPIPELTVTVRSGPEQGAAVTSGSPPQADSGCACSVPVGQGMGVPWWLALPLVAALRRRVRKQPGEHTGVPGAHSRS